MNMKASLLLVLVGLLCVSFASAQSSAECATGAAWCYCTGTGADGITVSDVTLNPNPPVLGTDDVVTLTGTVNETVSGGNVALTIWWDVFGLGTYAQVFSQTYSICASNTCPQGPGAITAQITVSGSSLPIVSPPGNYQGIAVVTDQNDNTLVCVAVPFTL